MSIEVNFEDSAERVYRWIVYWLSISAIMRTLRRNQKKFLITLKESCRIIHSFPLAFDEATELSFL